MKITLDKDFELLLKGKIAEYIDGTKRMPDGKIHVSSLLNPRRAYYDGKYGTKVSETEIGFFVSGIAFHELLQKVLGKQMSEVALHHPNLADIQGTADQVGVYFCEIKTNRKWTVPLEPQDHYVEQFAKYLPMAGRRQGHIVVIFFVAGRTWDGKSTSTLEIRTWKVEISDDEAAAELKKLEASRQQLLDARAGKLDPRDLPLCWSFMCGNAYQGELTGLCPHYHECKPQDRFPEVELLKVIGGQKRAYKKKGKEKRETIPVKGNGPFARMRAQ